MTRDVLITVRGIQRDEDGNETTSETVVRGEYYEKSGSRYLFYEELPEEETGAVKHTIKCRGNVLELTKKGVVSARMVFEPGQTHMTDYVTSYGMVQFGVKTHRVLTVAEEDFFEIRAKYALTAGEDILSECRILIKAEASP